MDGNENKYTSDSYYSEHGNVNQGNMDNAQVQQDNSWSAQVQQSDSQSAQAQQDSTWNEQAQSDIPQDAQTQNRGAWGAQAQYRQYEEPEKKKKEKKPRRKRDFHGVGAKLAKYVAVALVFGLVGGSAFAGSSYFFGRVIGNDSTSSAAKENVTLNKAATTTASSSDSTGNKEAAVVTDVSGIVDNVMPSIVAITNMSESQVQTWFGQMQNYESESAGSGIIVSQDSDYIYIATNNHVVADAKSLTVQFCDDSTVTAEVKGTDSSNDLAVVAVKISDVSSDTLKQIKMATIGDSDTLEAGQSAVAIGNALGYGQSVTTGVISALNREVSVTDDETGNTTTSELIQTDAAINPGNSGGALLNLNGEVIGINSVKYSDTSVEGMGYAIPINTASPIIEKLINREVVDANKTAYLGISGVDVSSSVAETYNMPEGIYIYQVVEGSAADKAGLAQGDIITAFDGTKVNSTAALEEQMQYYSAGTDVELTVQRLTNEQNGQYTEQKVTVTLGSK